MAEREQADQAEGAQEDTQGGRAQENTHDERGRAAPQDGGEQDNDSNRARQCNLPSTVSCNVVTNIKRGMEEAEKSTATEHETKTPEQRQASVSGTTERMLCRPRRPRRGLQHVQLV